MDRCRMRVLAILGAFIAGMAAGSPPPETIRLRHEPEAVLRFVASRMGVELRAEVPLPAIRLESETPLERFQDAIAPQWGFRPRRFANAYVVASNEIYLTDDASYYLRLRRTLDESLAHEFAHYVQVRYLAGDLAEPSYEDDAVAVQTHFRNEVAPIVYAVTTEADGPATVETTPARRRWLQAVRAGGEDLRAALRQAHARHAPGGNWLRAPWSRTPPGAPGGA